MSKDRKERLAKKARNEAHKRALASQLLRERIPLTIVGAKDVGDSRSCGECQACCEVVAIKGDNLTPEKKNYERCTHQCDTGCAIYQSRPVECRTYRCVWRDGSLTREEDRPDKLGVLVDTRWLEENGKAVFVFWETRPGALKTPRVQEIIQWIRYNLREVAVMTNEYNSVTEDEEKQGIVRKKLLVNPF